MVTGHGYQYEARVLPKQERIGQYDCRFGTQRSGHNAQLTGLARSSGTLDTTSEIELEKMNVGSCHYLDCRNGSQPVRNDERRSKEQPFPATKSRKNTQKFTVSTYKYPREPS